MQFNHDNMVGVELSVALVNLPTAQWTRHGLIPVLRAHRLRVGSLDRAQVQQLRHWATELRAAFSARTAEHRCTIVNELLSQGAGPAYLTMHDDMRPHLHFASDDDHVVSRARALTAGGLAIFTVEAAGRRLGECGRDDCTQVFCDTSRNGTRVYCSARCGNHDAVRRHRQRSS